MGIFMFIVVPIMVIAGGIYYPFYQIGQMFESIGNFFSNLF